MIILVLGNSHTGKSTFITEQLGTIIAGKLNVYENPSKELMQAPEFKNLVVNHRHTDSQGCEHIVIETTSDLNVDPNVRKNCQLVAFTSTNAFEQYFCRDANSAMIDVKHVIHATIALNRGAVIVYDKIKNTLRTLNTDGSPSDSA